MKPVLSFGRIMLGLAYVVYGYLHFAHTAADAAMVPQGVGRPVVWVILIGIGLAVFCPVFCNFA